MEKSKVFVIMPFSDDFFESYEMLKEHFKMTLSFHMQVMKIISKTFLLTSFLQYMPRMLF